MTSPSSHFTVFEAIGRHQIHRLITSIMNFYFFGFMPTRAICRSDIFCGLRRIAGTGGAAQAPKGCPRRGRGSSYPGSAISYWPEHDQSGTGNAAREARQRCAIPRLLACPRSWASATAIFMSRHDSDWLIGCGFSPSPQEMDLRRPVSTLIRSLRITHFTLNRFPAP
jgi:hypothetical protein